MDTGTYGSSLVQAYRQSHGGNKYDIRKFRGVLVMFGFVWGLKSVGIFTIHSVDLSIFGYHLSLVLACYECDTVWGRATTNLTRPTAPTYGTTTPQRRKQSLCTTPPSCN